MREFHIHGEHDGLVGAGRPALHASQISSAELAASTSQLSVESKNDQPTSSAVIGWATIFGIVIALGVLGMSVGLVGARRRATSARSRRPVRRVTRGAR
jgi:cell division protein FtsX